MEEEKGISEFPEPPISGCIGTLLTGCLVALVAVVATDALAYGYAVFWAIPLTLGYVSGLIVGAKGGALTYKKCAASAMWTMLFSGLCFFVLGAEGFVCILMAAPIAIPLALVGALLAFGTRKWIRSARQRKASSFVILGFLPMMISKDIAAPLPFVGHTESTSIVIDASPEKIWPLLCNLPNLPPPTEPLFRAGIAYPKGIRTEQANVGGLRHCQLSTGDMPETIEVFEPGRRLDFKVHATPPCMVETSPYGQIQTKHLKGYFECRRGRFLLVPMPGNRTRLIGTSWYRSRYAPDFYWTLWNDTIVEEVHQRVMGEIKRQAELPAPRG